MEINLKTAVLVAGAVFFYVICDSVSSIMAGSYLGSFDCESNLLLRYSYQFGGVLGFLAVKFIVSSLGIALCAWVAHSSPRIVTVPQGLLLGLILAGIYVSWSNINITINGSSFWFMGLDSGITAFLILMSCVIGGFVFIKPVPKPIYLGD